MASVMICQFLVSSFQESWKMAIADSNLKFLLALILIIYLAKCNANDILGCGGFVKSHVSLDYSKIEIAL